MVIEDRWVLDDRTFVSLMLAVVMREGRLRSAVTLGSGAIAVLTLTIPVVRLRG